MRAAYIFTPAIWPPLVGAICLMTLSLYSWRRRSVPAALPLAISSFFGFLWLLGVTFTVVAVDPATKIAWYRFQGACQLPAVTAMTCFALEYAYPGRWLTRRNLAVLALPALLQFLLIVTYGGQFAYRLLEIAPDGSVAREFTTPATILAVYGLSLGLINLAAFLWLAIRSPEHRWPVVLMLFGDITSRGLYSLYAFGTHLPLLTLLDSFVAAVLVNWSMYAIALFGFRIFDPLPMARRTAIEHMRDGVVMLDAGWQVVRLNPAAANILSTPAGRAQGKLLRQIQPALADSIVLLAETGTNPDEISLGPGLGARRYALHLSVVRDFRGSLLGHVLLMRDVTEQRRAQAQIVEQRTALATLIERDRLAKELHDGLGQVLSYVKMQAQVARRALEQDQWGQVTADLERIEAAAQDAHADVRDFLLGVSGDRLRTQGFRTSLMEYVQRFSRTYDIMTELRWPDDLRDADIEPEAQVQLLRIIQEALSNVRCHANTRAARLSLALDGAELRIEVHDDGCGFDPVLAFADDDARAGHYGLHFMSERAEGIGGRLQVTSAPGQGTDVIIQVPIHHGRNRDAPAFG